MPRIIGYALHAIDLPFRLRFKHAVASRDRSESVFLELYLDDGTSGWGEALPRSYVTGETRDGACKLLSETILRRLLGIEFESFDDVVSFLSECNGRAPDDWVPKELPQSAAWCAVDLALLDAFGRSFKRSLFRTAHAPAFRFSGVISSGRGWKRDAQLAAWRLLGFHALKLKVDGSMDEDDIRRVRRIAGREMDLRVDANMAWTVEEALERMLCYAKYGIRSFEQPLPADDLHGAAKLVRETGLDVMADESLHTCESLRRLIEAKACTAINARISKCGGLIAAHARCREALDAGLWVQVGCQVGESSLLSAAQLQLCGAIPELRYAEGCFGRLLLKEDPVFPLLRMGWGGCPPKVENGFGLGVEIDQVRLARHCVGSWSGGESHAGFREFEERT